MHPSLSNSRFTRTAIAATLAIAVGAPAYALFADNDAARVAETTAATASAMPQQALPDFAALVKRYGPAVVNISVRQDVHPASRRGEDDDSLAPFFRNLPPGFPQFAIPQPRRPQYGQGSGFIVAADGIILTNAHVIDGADEVTVKLTDKREFPAKVIGSDPTTDVAVVQIDAKNLPTVTLGNPEELTVGEWVVAIGSPFGFENSVTQGIVSAKGRSLPDENYTPFIQTDVAVNPGNSGGPLFNLRGEVVGINSQIYSRNGGYQGISFAIPIDLAMNVQQQLVADGHVTRGWLGVSIQGMDSSLADSFGLDQPSGALVAQVSPDSPAEDAGVEPGDVILSFNGQAVSDSSLLPPLVGATPPGDKVEMEVLRNGKRKTLKVKIAPLEQTASADHPGQDNGPGSLGVAVADLTPQQRQQAGIEDGGVIITGVGEGPAAAAGIRRGDVLLKLGKESVKSARQLSELTGKLPKDRPVAALVQRGDQRLFVPLDLG